MSQSFDLYQDVTNQILAMLEKGVVPWRSPILGRGLSGHPKNLASGKGYRGINVFLLAITSYVAGYESAYWLTFNQAKERGGSVRKGERSTRVVFWKQYETTDKQTGEPTTVPVMRFYSVFNAAQVDGIEVPDAVPFTPADFTPVEAAEKIIARYTDGPKVVHEGSRAFYRPSTDTIHIPEPSRFATGEEYYSTRFHEEAHGSGASSRLDRGLDTQTRPFGSEDYSKEELIAEMASAFLCARAGIRPAVIENQAAYLQGWLKQLKGDKKLVVSAAGAAQKAANWILGERGEKAE
jgi:antirestriction protein ArdC